MLRPGGRLVAQCGGEGNVEAFLRRVEKIADTPPFRDHIGGLERSWCFPGADETERRLRAAGFVEARAWLEPGDVVPRDPDVFLRAAPLRCHLEPLPPELREPFVKEILEACGEPLRLGFIRLNLEARRR